jgi:hypothetical protein
MNSTTPDRENIAQVDVQRARFEEQISQLLHDVARDDPSHNDTVAPAPSGWTLRGILLAACIGIVTLVWLQSSSGDPG